MLAVGYGALGGDFDLSDKFAKFKQYRGNQPSTTLLLDSLTPRTLGSLIALYEHKVYVMSVMWDSNLCGQWGVEVGKVMANSVDHALETGQTQGFDGSTNGLLARIVQAKMEGDSCQ